MIFHITHRGEWDRALRCGRYETESLAAEGFIHCSTGDQVVGTANLYYRAQHDLILLAIDERRLTAPLKFELPKAGENARRATAFPHIYGPLNLDAVIRVIDYPCATDGSFPPTPFDPDSQ